LVSREQKRKKGAAGTGGSKPEKTRPLGKKGVFQPSLTNTGDGQAADRGRAKPIKEKKEDAYSGACCGRAKAI